MEYEIEESLINEKVGAWLLEKENTREDLAGELGMHRLSLSNKLNDVTPWTWPEVLRLASVLGCSARDFVGGSTGR